MGMNVGSNQDDEDVMLLFHVTVNRIVGADFTS
jgi:hypothetical protein